MTKKLEGKVAIITGASAGIGADTADLLQNQKHVRFISFLSDLKIKR